LLRAQFERSAYGCRLYCCWCAQDLAGANRFWEAIGFVPLAYRAGSEKRGRVHIFWQKRIRAGDRETPWWFPAQTQGGSMADRLVLPIPPGMHWSAQMPAVVRPREELPVGSCQLPGKRRARASLTTGNSQLATASKPGPLCGGLMFAPVAPVAPVGPVVAAEAEKKPRERKAKAKNDPAIVAAARELRDRWLERVNAGAYVLASDGKYDVSRALVAPMSSSSSTPLVSRRAALLPAA
jgi:hypothetical protein